MISSVRGTVLAAVGTTVVIEVGGVGLNVQVTPQHALSLRVGSEATVRTALIVREDDLSLYGFSEADELTVFDLLRGVTGVGPKSAMGVLAAMSPGEIAQAVAVEDDAAFRKVSGIGPKTAKLIVVSLAGKLLVVPTARASAASRSSIAVSYTHLDVYKRQGRVRAQPHRGGRRRHRAQGHEAHRRARGFRRRAEHIFELRRVARGSGRIGARLGRMTLGWID